MAFRSVRCSILASLLLAACGGGGDDDAQLAGPADPGAAGVGGKGGGAGSAQGGSATAGKGGAAQAGKGGAAGQGGAGAAGTSGQAGKGGAAAGAAGQAGSGAAGAAGTGAQGGKGGSAGTAGKAGAAGASGQAGTGGSSAGGAGQAGAGGSGAAGSGGGAGGGAGSGGGPGLPAPVVCTHVGSGRDIQVGNPVVESGAAIVQVATIGEVDWNHLEPGDTVRIFHRAEPYREKILVRGKGTEAQPIRVCGVPSAAGELPHVTGENATTRPDLDYGDLSNLMEDLAVLAIYHRSYEQRPENIVVEGLKLSGTLGDPGTPAAVLSYTATNGTVRKYRSAAACLRIQEGKNVTIRGNELTGCGNGLFVLSRIPESQMTRNILIEGNVLHGNGVVGEEGIHNAYVQGVDITLQLNVFGPNRPGASGNALKLRVAGDVVRYNAFENGARILDLVEVEDHAEFVFPDKYAAFKAAYPTEIVPGDDERVAAAWKAYQRSYVYGNLIRNVGTGACTNVVHYSFDNVQNDRRPGTLYFYNNTIVNRTDFSKKAIVRLLDQGPWWGNSGPAVTNNTFDGYANVEAFNNVFVLESSTPGATRSYFEMTRYRADKLALGVNWWSSGWDAAIPGYNQAFPGLGNALVDNPAYVYPGGNDTHHVTGMSEVLTGDGSPIDETTFLPLAGGPLIGKAVALPAEIPPEHAVSWQLDPVTRKALPRAAVTALGAREAP